MCGLAGIVDFGGAVERGAAAAMAGLLVHRGPDDDELAFRRLAILDLSPAGPQPMTDETGRFTLVFNGEVYNYVEPRAELEARGRRFRSGGDTEVVLQAYAEWG